MSGVSVHYSFWNDCFSECCCCFNYQRSVECTCVGALFVPLSCLSLSFTQITFSWLLKLHSEPWSLVASLLQLCSSSILCWLFLGFFLFHYKLCNWFVNILKIPAGILIGIVLIRWKQKNWHLGNTGVFLSINMDHFFLYLSLWFLSSEFSSFPHIPFVHI